MPQTGPPANATGRDGRPRRGRFLSRLAGRGAGRPRPMDLRDRRGKRPAETGGPARDEPAAGPRGACGADSAATPRRLAAALRDVRGARDEPARGGPAAIP